MAATIATALALAGAFAGGIVAGWRNPEQFVDPKHFIERKHS